MAQLLWFTEEGRRRLDGIAVDAASLADAAARGTLLSVGRQAAAVSIGTLLVKWRTTRPGRKLRTCLRASAERREARALLRGSALGLGCPAPLVVAELRRGPLLAGALSVRPFLPGYRDGAAHLAAGGPIESMLRALRSWHDAGFRHGDCWPRNVLVSEDANACIPIGCPKAAFVAPGEDRRRVRDLARLLHGISRSREGVDRESLFRLYAEGGESLRTLWPSVVARIERLRARDARPKPSSLPARTPPFPHFPLWRGEWRTLSL